MPRKDAIAWVVVVYGQRMTIEELVRDHKNKRNGWSLRDTRITRPEQPQSGDDTAIGPVECSVQQRENGSMPGITTALLVFILVGVALPALIKSKAQFYCAVAFVAGAILLSPFAFVVFLSFIVSILQVLAFVALVLCAGGLELHEFAEHMVNAYDALRRGEEHPKPIIVPRTETMKKEPVTTPETIYVPPPAPEPVQESIPIEPAPEQEGGAPTP